MRIGSTTGTPLRTVATSEFVVPRSMPTAAAPGGARATIPARRFAGVPLLDGFVSGVDFGVELVEELQLPHQRGGAA